VYKTLRHTLQIVSALRDIVCYLVAFSRLGNADDARGADWGGAEGIEAELLELQRQVDLLSAPGCPRSVGRLLQLRRQVLLLQFDAAVRHLIRSFLSSGDAASYRSVSDNMATALPPLSDGLQPDAFSLTLPVPAPLEARGRQARSLFPWRSFMACEGLFPLDVWDVPPIERCMQVHIAEIFHPSMRALAQQMGTERDYEVSTYGGRSLLPPPGASEVDVKAWQLHSLLESTECDMIRAVQRRVNRELTLAVSERTRQDAGLPTELWTKAPLRYSLTPERPQIVETFVRQLMEGLTVSPHRLQRCLALLGCSLAERERRSFLLYSQFYEQILQHETRLLYRSEQVRVNRVMNPHGSGPQVDVACRGMMLQISALQTRVAHLEDERRTLEEQLGLRFKERYDPLVRHLFSTCIQLKAWLDEYRRRMQQDVSEMVNRVRGEGVDRILKLRKKHGCTKDGDGLAQLKVQYEQRGTGSRLAALLCQQKALSRWRQAVDHEKLRRQLLETQQVIASRKCIIFIFMVSALPCVYPTAIYYLGYNGFCLFVVIPSRGRLRVAATPSE
uniref:Uncharacterized protein n=1 Tax=Cyclopterus lumpus TaxID=8103 RepID=A0A8C3G8T4_CYCLU